LAAEVLYREAPETLEKLHFGLFGRKRRQCWPAQSRGRAAKKTSGLGRPEPGQLGRFMIGRDVVGQLDQGGCFRRQMRRQTEADMDCGEQSVLEIFVVDSDRRFEGAYQIADHVFGSIVQQGCKADWRTQTWAQIRDEPFDQQTVLRDRERMCTAGLPVPSCQPRKTVCDIGNLDVERRWIEQVESSPAQHALPGARWFG
jgi:hypothetical protein